MSGVAKGLAIIGSDGKGRRVYELRTRESTQSQVAENATLTNTRVTLYHEGVPDIIVAAPHARVDATSKSLVMWGRLTARAVRAKATFRVDRMTWSYETKAFVGTGGVHYVRKPVTMDADRVSGKTPLTRVNLDGNVKLTVNSE